MRQALAVCVKSVALAMGVANMSSRVYGSFVRTLEVPSRIVPECDRLSERMVEAIRLLKKSEEPQRITHAQTRESLVARELVDPGDIYRSMWKLNDRGQRVAEWLKKEHADWPQKGQLPKRRREQFNT